MLDDDHDSLSYLTDHAVVLLLLLFSERQTVSP